MSEALFEEQTVPAFELDHVPVQVKLIYNISASYYTSQAYVHIQWGQIIVS